MLTFTLVNLWTQPGLSETTTHNYRNQHVITSAQRARAVETQRVPLPPPRPKTLATSQRIQVQTTPRYMRNPSQGSRTQAITSRGGQAATQVCGGPIEILNRRGECQEVEFDRDFLAKIQTQGLACAQRAGQQAFGFVPTKIGLRTHMGQVSRGRTSANGRVSTHAVGRALDIFEVDIYNGRANNSVTMHKNAMNRRGHRTFYHQFARCWQQAVRGAWGRTASSCGSGCLTYEFNAAHHDHMHISLPPKDENRRRFGLNCI